MSKNVRPIPEGYHTVTPYLVIREASKAIDFYKKAFGAEELFRMPGPGGAIAHAEIQIGSSRLMVCEENPAMGAQSPQALGGSPANLFLYVEDVDQAYKKATDAGATATLPPQNMFWGDRYGKLVDPYGHEWSMATHVEDVPPDEMAKRAQAAFAEK